MKQLKCLQKGLNHIERILNSIEAVFYIIPLGLLGLTGVSAHLWLVRCLMSFYLEPFGQYFLMTFFVFFPLMLVVPFGDALPGTDTSTLHILGGRGLALSARF